MKTLFYGLLLFFIITSIWLFCYSLHYYIMLIVNFKSRKQKKAKQPSKKMSKTNLPMVTIQLPIFNEMFVSERLIRRVSQMDYPKEKLEIQILDDSTDETIIITKNIANELKEKGYNIKWIHRKDRTGYKGGALKSALAVAEGEFVAIFDADFLPPKNFLKKTIPHFENPEIGLVQCRWVFMNPEYSFLTKLQKITLDGHFVLEQKGRYISDKYFSFNGSAGIWRKETIFDAGDWNGDTLTEDLDLSYRAQFKGWKFKYLPEVEVPSELPVMMSGYKSQQFRWAKGFIQCSKKLIKPVLKSKAGFFKKFEALTHLTSHFSYIIMAFHLILSLPMVFLMKKFGYLINDPILFGLFAIIMIFGMSAPLVFLYSAQRRERNSVIKTLLQLPIIFVMNLGLIVHLSKAVWEGIIGKKSGFVRTPKFNIKNNGEKTKAGRKYKSAFDTSTIIELFAIGYAILIFVLSIKFKVYLTTLLMVCYISGLSIVTGTLILQHYKNKFRIKLSSKKKTYHVQWIHPAVTSIENSRISSGAAKKIEMQ